MATITSPSSNDYFGRIVDLSNQYLVVNAALSDVGGTDTGSIYLYDLSASTTTPLAAHHNPIRNRFLWHPCCRLRRLLCRGLL